MEYLSEFGYSKDIHKQYLYFGLCGKKYVLDAVSVLRIIDLPELIYPQRLPVLLCGLLKYNDTLINVLNPCKVLNLPLKKFSTQNQLLVLDVDDTIFGLIVDNVIDLVAISDDKLQNEQFNSENGIIRYTTELRKMTTFVIDVIGLKNYMLQNSNIFKDSSDMNYLNDDENSKAVFHSRQKVLAEKSHYTDEKLCFDGSDYLCFDIKNYHFGIKTNDVLKIVNSPEITFLPCAPRFVKGIIFHRGDFFTVIDLNSFLGFESHDEVKNEKIIILNSQNFKIAITIDSISGIKKISDDQIEQNTDKNDFNSLLTRELVIENQLFYILNAKKLLSSRKLLIFDSV